jgi:hypothetical protein
MDQSVSYKHEDKTVTGLENTDEYRIRVTLKLNEKYDIILQQINLIKDKDNNNPIKLIDNLIQQIEGGSNNKNQSNPEKYAMIPYVNNRKPKIINNKTLKHMK